MKHFLSQVDTETRTALCAICGPVSIKRGGYTLKGTPRWRCKVQASSISRGKTDRREYRRLVTKDSVCERCGFIPTHECQLDVHRHRDPDPEILCANCHRLITLEERGIRVYVGNVRVV